MFSWRSRIVLGDENDTISHGHAKRANGLPVNLRFPLPRVLVAREEDLDGDAFAVPDAAPHLAVTAPADALAQRHLAGHRALDEQRQAGTRARRDRVLEVFLQKYTSIEG